MINIRKEEQKWKHLCICTGEILTLLKGNTEYRKEISDFSGNINPFGFPKKAAEKLAQNISIVCNYPDKNYIALKNSISLYTGAKPENIVVGNGSTELISTFIKSVCAKKTIIMALPIRNMRML